MESTFDKVPIDSCQTHCFVIKNPNIAACFGSYGVIFDFYTIMCSADVKIICVMCCQISFFPSLFISFFLSQSEVFYLLNLAVGV